VFHSGPVDAWRERERALRGRGHEVRLLSSRRWNEGGSDVVLVARPGEDVVGVRTIGRHPALFLYDPRPIWRALGEHWDVVDVQEEPFSLAVAELRLLMRMRGRTGPFTLYSAQNIAKRYPFPFRRLERDALRAASGVSVCNAEAGRIVTAKGLRVPASLIPLGVDTTAFSPSPDVEPRPGVVGYVGRLEAHKGVDTLVDAVVTDPTLTLEVAGAGPTEAALRTRAAPAGDRIRFVGPVDHDDLPSFYRSIDVLAVPSVDTPGWREQFGRVVVEALACGTPVVTSDGGALPEVVGAAGVVVPQGDPAALGAALSGVVADRSLRDRLAAAGPGHAAACSWAEVAQDLEEMYVRAAGAPAGTDAGDHELEVVVVAFGRPDLLASALAPLGDLPVTVVDNSSDAQVRRVSGEAGARYLDPGRNLGFGAAVNVALREPLRPGSDVLLLNPDAVVTEDTVEALHKRLRADPGLAAVAPAQVDGADHESRVRWPLPTPVRAWREAVGLGAGLPDEYVIGSVLLLSRAAVDDVGGFDEDFFLYAEETDWEKRALDRGWRIGFAPELVASHLGAGTSSDPRRRELLFHAAQERYYRKHHGTLGWQAARAARLAGDSVRAVVAAGDQRTEARRRLSTYRTGPQRALRRLDGGTS
jgi:glycosyltransferase involved in cell wall biosynthesis/GT2 family glycosyltransferase